MKKVRKMVEKDMLCFCRCWECIKVQFLSRYEI